MATTVSMSFYSPADVTAYLLWGSLTVKLNTADFTLLDPPLAVSPFISTLQGTTVTITDPPWTGTVVKAAYSDVVDINSGHFMATISATNSTAIATTTVPFNLSNVPANATTMFELEDGTGHITLEAGTPWSTWGGTAVLLTEGTLSFGYSGLTVSQQTNTDASVSTLGQLTCWQPGLWPGQSFVLTTTNMPGPLASTSYTVSQVTVTWPAFQGNPSFLVEFGTNSTDISKTMNYWKAH